MHMYSSDYRLTLPKDDFKPQLPGVCSRNTADRDPALVWTWSCIFWWMRMHGEDRKTRFLRNEEASLRRIHVLLQRSSTQRRLESVISCCCCHDIFPPRWTMFQMGWCAQNKCCTYSCNQSWMVWSPKLTAHQIRKIILTIKDSIFYISTTFYFE